MQILVICCCVGLLVSVVEGFVPRNVGRTFLPSHVRNDLGSSGYGHGHASLGLFGKEAAVVAEVKRPFFETVTSLVPGQMFAAVPKTALFATAALALVGVFLNWFNKSIWTATRTYNQEANTVGKEYDAWTEEGILEYYWGEHIHLGYYDDAEIAKGYKKKNFIQAKYDFIDEMAKFGDIANSKPAKVLDVGCGIGGTTRYLAKMYGEGSEVVGISLSSNQVQRATALAADRDLKNAKFQVMDALKMDFPDNSFDVVWACESGEHMPDKKKYVEEMTRVLKPGGRIVIATWCQRDNQNKPFNKKERQMLDFLYSEWTHPYFISISDYAKLMLDTAQLETIKTDDWAKSTIPSWRHSIWVGVFDPWPVFIRPHLWYKCFRDGLTLERMHGAFTDGLMQYGMMTATKKAVVPEAVAPAAE